MYLKGATLKERLLTAFICSFTKKKVFIIAPIFFLALIGALFVDIFSTLQSWKGIGFLLASFWIILLFLIFLGVFLNELYQEEKKKRKEKLPSYIQLTQQVFRHVGFWRMLIVGGILFHFLNWILLGFFLLCIKIPVLGMFLSFLPFIFFMFLLLFGALAVTFVFFAIPFGNRDKNIHILSSIIELVKEDLFRTIYSFFLGIFLLILPALFFHFCFSTIFFLFPSSSHFSFLIQKIVVCIPISICFAPFIAFFFHWGSELHLFLKEKKGEK